MSVELPCKRLPDTFNLQNLIVIPFENFTTLPYIIKYGIWKTHKQGM